MNDSTQKIEWQASVSIFKNSHILKQLSIAIGIPFGILILFLIIVPENNIYKIYSLILIVLLFFITWLFIMLVYKGNYDAEFLIDSKGITCRTQTTQAKKNKLVNTLTIVLGAISKNPTATGAGLLAQSRQQVFIKWTNIRKIKYKPVSMMILVFGGFSDNLALFCTSQNYYEVEAYIKTKMSLNN